MATSKGQKPRSRRRRKRKLTREEKAERRRNRKFITDIQTVFTNARFRQIPTRNTDVTIAGRKGEIDSLFVYENVLVLIEDTTGKNVKDHIAQKASFFSHIESNREETLRVLSSKFPRFRSLRSRDGFDDSQYRWFFVYCSLHTIDRQYENRFRVFKLLQYPNLRYFLRLSKIIGGSVRYEIFRFLGLEMKDIGMPTTGKPKDAYTALVLPESPSGFPDGHKIVSFLIEPETLIERAYVLRQDGWEDTDCLYQRLLGKEKIRKMRQYLAAEGRVFVNNIIATLPDETRFLDAAGKQIPSSRLSPDVAVTVELERSFGSIGLVDGQHRVFAYHEGMDKLERKISLLRKKQNLLVTGIVYPPAYDQLARTRFEAKLFLEINDKQTRAKGDLKQAIQTVVDPFSDVAIAKRVVSWLAESGPLCGLLERHFFDQGKVKTTSIVSYGVRYLVAIEGEHSLFGIWDHAEKERLKDRRRKGLLDEYVAFCGGHLSGFVGGFRQSLPREMWVTNRKVSRALTTTTINGLVYCLRQVLQHGKAGDQESYAKAFKRRRTEFTPEKFTFHSSHWRELGKKLYSECFE